MKGVASQIVIGAAAVMLAGFVIGVMDSAGFTSITRPIKRGFGG